MKKKIRGLIYALSENSRVKTTELSKLLAISQQSASYLIQSLHQKKIINGHSAIIDPAKFGYIYLMTHIDYTDFSASTIRDIVKALRNEEYVVHLEHLEHGHDLSATFCVPNLSLFNKLTQQFLYQFRGKVVLSETFPVVVKHIYPRAYLTNRRFDSEMVICGDRDVAHIPSTDLMILTALWHNPTENVIGIYRKTKLNPKTIIKIRKKLESERIIRGYTSIFDFNALGIRRRQLFFRAEDISLSEDKKLLEYARIHPNIVGFTRLIGQYGLLFDVEGENLTKKDVLKELRTQFGFKKYKVITCGKVEMARFVPRSILS